MFIHILTQVIYELLKPKNLHICIFSVYVFIDITTLINSCKIVCFYRAYTNLCIYDIKSFTGFSVIILHLFIGITKIIQVVELHFLYIV